MAQSCPACQHSGKENALRSYKRCANCGLLYSDMHPADGEWYARSWIYKFWKTSRPMSAQAIKRRWEWQQFFTAVRTVGGTLLDVGCGEGHFLHAARLRGLGVQGVDFNPESVSIAKHVYGLDVVCEDLSSFVQRETTFDYVTAFETLEHVAEPIEFLRALSRIGSIVAISVPCAERQPPVFARGVDEPPHHLTLWTRKSIEIALDAAGLETVQLTGNSFTPRHLGFHVSCLVGGSWPLNRYVRAAAGAVGMGLGYAVRGRDAGDFALFALARTRRQR